MGVTGIGLGEILGRSDRRAPTIAGADNSGNVPLMHFDASPAPPPPAYSFHHRLHLPGCSTRRSGIRPILAFDRSSCCSKGIAPHDVPKRARHSVTPSNERTRWEPRCRAFQRDRSIVHGNGTAPSPGASSSPHCLIATESLPASGCELRRPTVEGGLALSNTPTLLRRQRRGRRSTSTRLP